MAGATITRTVTGMPDSDVVALRLEYNKLVDDVEVLRAGLAAAGAKINAMLGAADFTAMIALADVVVTSYDAAGDLAAAKIASSQGSTTV